MSVVGIDFGCTNTVIAQAGRGGVDVVLNGASNRLNPTLVGFDDARKMGEQATSGISSNYQNTITCMKRLVGLAFDDPRAVKEMKLQNGLTFRPVPHAAGGPPSIGLVIHQGQGDDKEQVVPIEHIAGMMIHHMGEIVGQRAAQGSDNVRASDVFPQDWVVAIPNYFTDAQRRAMQAACEIVGINGVQRLMHENTATALSYGIFKDLKKEFTKDNPTNVMFIDFGASAYTVSIATFLPGQLSVKASYCDPDLGGRDFDWLIAEWIAEKFATKYKGKLSAAPMDVPKCRIKLLTNAEKAKKTLSPAGVTEARLYLEMLLDDYDFSATLTAHDYEAMCAPLLARLEPPIRQCLAEAKLTAADLAAVELVGGSTRIGCVKRKLLDILKGGVSSLSTTTNADEAVARGAALQSAILSPRFKVLPYDIIEAQPYPIQVSWPPVAAEESSTVTMFERNVAFPIVRRVTLKRAGPFQVQAAYDPIGVEQYGLSPGLSTEIATFEINNTAKAETKVRVNIKQDIHGIVQLSSAQMVEEVVEDTDAASKKEGEEPKQPAAEGQEEKKKKVIKTNLECTVKRPLDWTRTEINKYNEIEVSMANTDRIVRETAHMRNELESYIYDMRDKIMADSHYGPYGTEQEKADFTAQNEAMEQWLYEQGYSEVGKTVFAEKLAELQALGGPLERRLQEAQNRPAAVTSLQGTLEVYQNWVNAESQTDERYSHITDEEREKVRAKAEEISTWMYEMLDKQGNLAVNQDPMLTVHMLNQKQRELSDACAPIMYKPKPAAAAPVPAPDPPAAAPAAEDTTKTTDNAKTTDDAMEGVEVQANGDKMEVDAGS